MPCCSITKRNLWQVLAASVGAFAVLGAVQNAHAATLFATSLEGSPLVLEGSRLVKADTSALTTSTLFNTPVQPDSLIFDTSGRIIYSGIFNEQVRRFDPNTNTDVLLASGFGGPQDLTLEPGGNSVLVSAGGEQAIERIDLTTNAVSTLTSKVGIPQGITYDNAGRLFVNSGYQVFQLDPVTGAILNQSPLLHNLDGLGFDSFTGNLFAGSLIYNVIYQLNPANLSSVSVLTSDIPGPDGLEADGMGNLFVASRGDSHIYQYDLTTKTLTQNVLVPGLDDLALAAGLGAPPVEHGVVPEPSSLALLLTGGLRLLGLRRRAA